MTASPLNSFTTTRDTADTTSVSPTVLAASEAKPLLLKHLQCHYHDHLVVKDVTLALDAGDIACLLGASGCGKTTVLRSIAGFHPLSLGEIHLGERLLSSQSASLAPEKRRVGMVFQDYALFPHLSVADNITFGLHKQPKAERRKRCQELLRLIQLEGMENRTPDQLSGGQQQRVALARALAPKPDLLLLDEPFSSLDSRLRRELARNVRKILKQQGTTAIMVTHDQDEAFAVADKVGIMDDGQLLQWGTPTELYHQPAAPFVASFLGQGHWLEGNVVDNCSVETTFGVIQAQAPSPLPLEKGQSVQLWLRPEDIHLRAPTASNHHSPTILDKTFEGARTRYQLQLTDGCLLSARTNNDQWRINDPVMLEATPQTLIAFPASE